ncbi:Hypothetical predicted protein [Paramuricea clavata]|uniref:Reverse transcriptase domain-containing protein n=1 Tax=Paramuricea clavata TaxID=317549 RepID=A0A7D9HAA8_PARCT|nr:Hypothetical predicted protein [Paramuricea clavata]
MKQKDQNKGGRATTGRREPRLQCKLCGKQVSSMGQSKQQVRTVRKSETSESDADDNYLLTVTSPETVAAVQSNSKKYPSKIFETLIVNKTPVKYQLDCGATVNIIPEDIYQLIFEDPQHKLLEKCNTQLIMFNKSVMTAQLDLMMVNTDNVLSMSVPQAWTKPTLTRADILSQYNDVFTGKVPLAMKSPIKQELDRLEGLDIIKPVSVLTNWVSSMVAATKRNGTIRLCLDPKPLNKALKRNLYPLPTMDDLLPDLATAKVFSVVDAKNVSWHVPLDEASSYLTAFSTPWSRYRWTRMPFVISPAPEEFQRRMENDLQGLPGVTSWCMDRVLR